MVLNPNFFLGRFFDLERGQALDEPLYYDPANLTTHAVVTGMTGSGKTGMCIGILEEAALRGIPAIIVDPKGDLTNLLLHFPDLAGKDFEPWLDPELPRRLGKTLPDLAEETAHQWREGLAGWGLGRPDLLALQSAVQFNIYTPGSSAGTPVNILSSFAVPELPWSENREVLREKISSTVTAILGLVGITEIDPLRSREHILLSNLLETSWSQGKPIDLTELILQVQKPPFSRLGAFPLENFFPEKDRSELAMLLNNFLAAPSFQTWLEGQALDMGAILYTQEGQPRHSIFYLAHLSENERMFFVTLLFAALEAWMRAQRGTSNLRALVYFDEIVGYLPPVVNPPSRPVLLRMLKQARAFGVGLLLATQNPVDLDYKALSNAGTWIIGRLQTERDKQRLLEGLQSAGGSVDIAALNRSLSGLQKRVFVLHSVYLPAPRLFTSRWTLNFLAGPLTRAQIPALNQLAGSTFSGPASSPETEKAGRPAQPPLPTAEVVTQPVGIKSEPAGVRRTTPDQPSETLLATPATIERPAYSSTSPAVPPGVDEYYLPNDLGVSQATAMLNIDPSLSLQVEGILYRPALLAQAEAHYLSRKYNFQYNTQRAVLVMNSTGGRANWEESAWQTYDPTRLFRQPLPQARFMALPGWLSDGRLFKTYQMDFIDWIYRTGTIQLRANEALGVYGRPDSSTAEFRELCSQAARTGLNAELRELETTFNKRLDDLKRKIGRQRMEVEEQEDEVSQRRTEQWGATGELILSMFSRRRRSITTSLTKARLAQQAKADLDGERHELGELEKQFDALEQELSKEVRASQERWAKLVNQVSEVPLALMKKDIYLELFGVAWLPHYLLKIGDHYQDTPAYSPPPR